MRLRLLPILLPVFFILSSLLAAGVIDDLRGAAESGNMKAQCVQV